ncbi:MAG: NAD(P)-dependent oxidoreductase, partial [Bacteroidota bacterium]
HLIGAAELDRLPAGAFVVNTARGEILDEVALVERLRSGAVAGAAVDVIANEHRVGVDSHPLIEYANAGGNVLITPHIGGAAEEAIAQTDAFIARKWIAAFGLQPIR